MKNLIVQIFMNKKGWEEEHRLDGQSEQVLFLSNALVKYYAKKNNSDYKLITKPIINFKHPTWERFQLFDDKWIDTYDNILYLDTDVFTWPDAPNIFEVYDDEFCGVLEVSNFAWVHRSLEVYGEMFFPNLSFLGSPVPTPPNSCILKTSSV